MRKIAAISLLLLGLCAVPLLLRQRDLTAAQANYRQLEATAATLGITPAGGGVRLTKLQREEAETKSRARVLASTALAVEFEKIAQVHGRGSPEYLEQEERLITELAAMEGSQLRTFLTDLRKNARVSEATLREICYLAIGQQARTDPHFGLSLIDDFAALLPRGRKRSDLFSELLRSLAEQQPAAAQAWITHHRGKFYEFATDTIATEVLRGAAQKDPRAAFKLITQLQVQDPTAAVRSIIEAGSPTAETRSGILAALRDHLATLTEPGEREQIRRSGMESLAGNLDAQGIDAMAGWITKAKLTPEEKSEFAGGLNYFTTREDTGRWVEWLAKNLPPEGLAKPVTELMGQWTQQDYQKAGAWLAAAAEGPAKQAAVQVYAGAVAEYEPKIAEQWAMTLPAGPIKDETLRVIYRNWPSNDPQGASKFAGDHHMN
jgi:hypothetical protein